METNSPASTNGASQLVQNEDRITLTIPADIEDIRDQSILRLSTLLEHWFKETFQVEYSWAVRAMTPGSMSAAYQAYTAMARMRRKKILEMWEWESYVLEFLQDNILRRTDSQSLIDLTHPWVVNSNPVWTD